MSKDVQPVGREVQEQQYLIGPDWMNVHLPTAQVLDPIEPNCEEAQVTEYIIHSEQHSHQLPEDQAQEQHRVREVHNREVATYHDDAPVTSSGAPARYRCNRGQSRRRRFPKGSDKARISGNGLHALTAVGIHRLKAQGGFEGPLSFAIPRHKTEHDYMIAFEKLKKVLQSANTTEPKDGPHLAIIVNFEEAVIKAARRVFPECSLEGWRWHLSQAGPVITARAESIDTPSSKSVTPAAAFVPRPNPHQQQKYSP
ncbi:hypothetical protein Aduo_019130 [Ancylostoma duodenale]